MLVYAEIREKEYPNDSVAYSQCKNIVRLLNYLIKKGHFFSSPVNILYYK